jgi:hypothetical protein
MRDEDALDEIDLARLIAALPAAPEAWVRAAELLPLAHDDLDALVERCREDAKLRERVIAGLEAALQSAHADTRRRAGDVRERF